MDVVHFAAGKDYYLAEYDRDTGRVEALVAARSRPRKPDLWRYALARLKPEP